ncbi:MAG: hypothetical protein WDO56_19930 [Gammaproteobacteria bacterium]
MSATWFMSTVVCDDVRKEEGNKLSYMGVYGNSILLPSFPFTLAKLCFVMTLMGPGTRKAPKSLVFRLFRDEDLLAEISLPAAALSEAARNVAGGSTRDSKRLTIGTVLQLFPLQLATPCVLKARAICDGEEIKGGAWPVESPSP